MIEANARSFLNDETPGHAAALPGFGASVNMVALVPGAVVRIVCKADKASGARRAGYRACP